MDFYSDRGPDLLGPVTVQTLIVSNLGCENEQIQRQIVRLDSQKDQIEIGQITFEPTASRRSR